MVDAGCLVPRLGDDQLLVGDTVAGAAVLLAERLFTQQTLTPHKLVTPVQADNRRGVDSNVWRAARGDADALAGTGAC